MQTRAEYLRARGWFSPVDDMWADGNAGCLPTADAVTIQRARDAVEERAAWVAFAAARLIPVHRWSRDGGSSTEALCTEPGAAESADAMLAEYRARFAAPARFDDEVTP